MGQKGCLGRTCGAGSKVQRCFICDLNFNFRINGGGGFKHVLIG